MIKLFDLLNENKLELYKKGNSDYEFGYKLSKAPNADEVLNDKKSTKQSRN